MDIKVFISLPMKGRTDEEILAEIDSAKAKAMKEVPLHYAEDDHITFIDSFLKDYDPGDVQFKPLAYLGKSLQLMANADTCCFAPGWKEARGCKIEHDAAIAYGLHIIYL